MSNAPRPRRKADSAGAPSRRPTKYVASATTSAGTTSRRSERDSASSDASWSTSSASAAAYSGPASTTASVVIPLSCEQLLHLASGVVVTAAADRRERDVAGLPRSQPKVLREGVAGDLR